LSVLGGFVLEDQSDDLSAELNQNHKDEKAMHLELHEAETLDVALNQSDE
jgi:hypothetical protein